MRNEMRTNANEIKQKQDWSMRAKRKNAESCEYVLQNVKCVLKMWKQLRKDKYKLRSNTKTWLCLYKAGKLRKQFEQVENWESSYLIQKAKPAKDIVLEHEGNMFVKRA